MSKFQDRYRNESIRAQWWNYANVGAYFITICTAGREQIFGKITDQKMHLSPIGEIVDQEWKISFDMRAELFCDNFVIMPNHIHAILRIENDGGVRTHGPVGTHGRASPQDRPSPQNRPSPQDHPPPQRAPKSISSFVAGFKSSATKRINEYRNSPKIPVWQSRFHDHIIRNNTEYQRIYQYIDANVENWEKD